MALDFDGIANALAARFLAAQLTAPTGYATIRSSTANPPGAIGPTPCVIVTIAEGGFETGQGTRTGSQSWFVRFYFDQTGDLERAEVGLRKWLGVLVNQLLTTTQLGGLVVVARIMSWRVGVLTYAVTDHSGIEMTVETETSEPWSATA